MKQLCLVLIAACFFAACNSTTTPTNTITYHHVSVGDAFSMDKYELTETGAIKTGSRDTAVALIDAVGLSMEGKTNVFRVIETSNNDMSNPDTTFYNYESTNDISLRASSILSETPFWIKIPVASSGTFTSVFSNTVNSGGTNVVETDSVVATSAGDETMTIHGTSVSVRKVNMLMIITQKSAFGTQKITMTVTGYFAPSLGYVTRMSSVSDFPLMPSTEERMIGYVIK